MPPNPSGNVLVDDIRKYVTRKRRRRVASCCQKQENDMIPPERM